MPRVKKPVSTKKLDLPEIPDSSPVAVNTAVIAAEKEVIKPSKSFSKPGLTEEKIEYIKAMVIAGELTHQEIATLANVDPIKISRVIKKFDLE